MKKSEIKFKKGKLYRVIDHGYNNKCVGCILKYEGRYKSGKIIKPGEFCKRLIINVCDVFQDTMSGLSRYDFVEHINMVKFCKKLKKKLDKEQKV